MARYLAFRRLAWVSWSVCGIDKLLMEPDATASAAVSNMRRGAALVAKISRHCLYGTGCGTERRESIPQYAALCTLLLASTCRFTSQRRQYCRSMRQLTVAMTQPSEGNESASNMMMR